MVNQFIKNHTLSCLANFLALLHACMLVSVTLEALPFVCSHPLTHPNLILSWRVGPPAIAGKGNLPTVVARQCIIIFTQVANHMYRLLWQPSCSKVSLLWQLVIVFLHLLIVTCFLRMFHVKAINGGFPYAYSKCWFLLIIMNS